MKRIFTTTLRLDMNSEEDRQAWSYLQQLDKKQHRSYSKAIVTAINDYFGRQERLANDPYLETREKENDFLQQIMDTITFALRFVPTPMPSTVATQSPETSQQTIQSSSEDDLSTALDFADSF